MEEVLLIDATERMLNGEMSAEEKIYFEALRKENPEIDQLVVEYTSFLKGINSFGNNLNFRDDLAEIRQKLIAEGVISIPDAQSATPIVPITKKYKRVIAVAASIAGIVSLVIASIISTINTGNEKTIKPLVEKINQQENKTRQIEQKVNQLSGSAAPVARLEASFRATGFMIDANNNYIVTNAHVVKEAKNNLIIENSKGDQFAAKTIYVNAETDIAFIQITDSAFKKMPSVPYAIKKNYANLGDPIFLMGYPKQEIVYGEGYISAMNGFQMDSVFYQLSTPANEGNSGSPVINRNGEIIGIISSMETNAEGVVYAIKSGNLFSEAENIKATGNNPAIHIQSRNSLKGLGRQVQIKKVQDYIFMVKGN